MPIRHFWEPFATTHLDQFVRPLKSLYYSIKKKMNTFPKKNCLIRISKTSLLQFFFNGLLFLEEKDHSFY